MQHNALHGAEKKDYTKDQDIPTTKSTPPQAASAVSTPDDTLLLLILHPIFCFLLMMKLSKLNISIFLCHLQQQT